MLDQLPPWLRQATLQSQLPQWMQDPPPKKTSPDLAGTLDWLNQKLQALGPKAVQQVKGMAQEAVSGRYPFIGMVGTGELGVAPKTSLLRELLKEGGATLTREGKPFAGTAYMVADPALTVKTSDPAEIARFTKRKDVQAALKAGGHYGKWVDPETKVAEINISHPFASKADALAVARKRGEKAIGHIQNGEYQGDIPSIPPRIGTPAIRVHVPGEKEPRIFTGAAHPFARVDAEDALGDLLDENFEPRFQIDEGFLADDMKTWLDRKAGLASAKYHKQLGGNARALENVKRSGQLKAEALKQPDAYAEAVAASKSPAIIVKNGWKPTSRGVFDRNAPELQGTAEVDPRLFPPTKVKPSKLAQAVANSKVVQRGLLEDTEKGLPKGGLIWYEGGPIKQSFEEIGGPFSFHDFNLARGSGSIQTPTHNEIANATALLYARRHGIPLDDVSAIKSAFQKMYPGEGKLWLNNNTLANYRRAVAADAHLPSQPGSAELKLPGYTQGNEGGTLEGGLPALDTHERRRMVQLAAQDPSLAKLLKSIRIPDGPGKSRPMVLEGRQADIIPIQNAADYRLLSQPYSDISRQLGLPSVHAGQAGRWIGGGTETGLFSQPQGDFVQTLEDVLLHTSMTRGLPTSSKALRSLWERLATGQDIATPIYGKDPLAYLYK